jgi:hypothetical protein
MIFGLLNATPRTRKYCAFTVLAVLSLYVWLHRSQPGHDNLGLLDTEPLPKVLQFPGVPFHPTYETLRNGDGIPESQIVWQLPAEGTSSLGIVAFFHGCGHRATDFWPQHIDCERCVGLPEEMHLVQAALLRYYLVS